MTSAKKEDLYTLWIQDDHNTPGDVEDLVINQEIFPTAKKGSVFEIYHPERIETRILLQVENFFPKGTKGQIRVSRQIADLRGLQARKPVLARMVDPRTVSVDHIELSIKDQYLNRGDMWLFQLKFCNTCVYVQKKLNYAGIRMIIGRLTLMLAMFPEIYINDLFEFDYFY
eukprot:TRINITY_DN18313_c0_g1_i1.p1 TRINITY_DN18313_c0_g1~~TRINITY_DN18313_c0_g1_i1.p1  ORF type:complete len:171 (-),score=25.30 TRINITY_DN18313_c0_g1_i1:17-529(-)